MTIEIKKKFKVAVGAIINLAIILSICTPAVYAYIVQGPDGVGETWAYARLDGGNDFEQDTDLYTYTFSFESSYGVPPEQTGPFQVHLDWGWFLSAQKQYSTTPGNPRAFGDATLYYDGISGRVYLFTWETMKDWANLTYDPDISPGTVDHSYVFEAHTGITYSMELYLYAETTSGSYGWVEAQSKLVHPLGVTVFDDEPNPIPIPGAAWLFGSGLIGLVGLRRKFR